MTAAAPILLVGNSINQLNNAQSWDGVLDQLRAAAKSPDCRRGNAKPYPIYFEELVCRAQNEGVSESDFLEAVAKPFRLLNATDYHRRLMSLNTQHILTTNYDYALELAAGPWIPRVDIAQRWEINESKFSLFRRNRANRKWVWHIHGEALVPSSIMLGHDHYVNQAGQLRTYWNTGVSYSSTGKINCAVKRNRNGFEGGKAPYSWLDIFALNPVHICGLSFDFAETVLWYALSRRRALADNPWRLSSRKIPSMTCGMADVTYHYFEGETPCDMTAARVEVFRSMGVKCVPYQVLESDYSAAWGRLLSHLEREIGCARGISP